VINMPEEQITVPVNEINMPEEVITGTPPEVINMPEEVITASPPQSEDEDFLSSTGYTVGSNVAGAVGASADAIEIAANLPAGASRSADALRGLSGTTSSTLSNFLGPVGLVTGGIGMGQAIDTLSNTEDTGTQIQGVTDLIFNTAGTIAGGVGTIGATGAALTALGEYGAGAALTGLAGGTAATTVGGVATAAAGGYALGTLADMGWDAAGTALLGETSYGDFFAETFLGQDPSESAVNVGGADHSYSGLLSEVAYGADRYISGMFADPDRPAYQQTLGWQLGEWLGI
jgi:hypothetical protein